MSARSPNLSAALADLAFALIAFASGWAGARLEIAALVLLAAITSWAWLRRQTLARMSVTQRLSSAAMALAVIGAVLGVCYWLGLQIRG